MPLPPLPTTCELEGCGLPRRLTVPDSTYCSDRCAAAAAQRAGAKTRPATCLLRGCARPIRDIFSLFCGDAHRDTYLGAQAGSEEQANARARLARTAEAEGIFAGGEA